MIFGPFILLMIVLLDGILISVAKDPATNYPDLSYTPMGWILSIFAVEYALFHTLSGNFQILIEKEK